MTCRLSCASGARKLCLGWETDQDRWSSTWLLPVAWASSQHGCLRVVFLQSSGGLHVPVPHWIRLGLHCLFTLPHSIDSREPTQ